MKTIYPEKLQAGDEIRVIAPSASLAIISQRNISLAIKKLQEMGYRVSFGKNTTRQSKDLFDSTSAQKRARDIMDAFKDKNVKMILCAIGGYNANQLLNLLDYDIIRNNPKALCGYSDITILNNAIFAKTGLVTYSGSSFSLFAMQEGLEYTVDYFIRCLAQLDPFIVEPSPTWSDDEDWYKNQKQRKFIKNNNPYTIQSGKARGTIIGGNLCTLNLLQGTPYMPSLKNAILFLEDDALVKGKDFAKEFDRNLQSLLQQKNANSIRGIVFGRFQKAAAMTDKKLRAIVATKPELKYIPIIAGSDFGHTYPLFTFPVGGVARLECDDKNIALEIVRH